MLILIRDSEKCPPTLEFLCVRLIDGNVPGSIMGWWEALGWDGFWSQKELRCFPEMQEALLCLVGRPARGFPSPWCCPDYQIMLAGALIRWMLHCSDKLSSSSRMEQKKKKKKPVMSRNRSRTWASCSEMSICMHIFQMKEEVLLLTIKKPSPRYSDDGFVSAFRLFREVFSSAL